MTFLIKMKHTHIPQHLLWPPWFWLLCGHHRLSAGCEWKADSVRSQRSTVCQATFTQISAKIFQGQLELLRMSIHTGSFPKHFSNLGLVSSSVSAPDTNPESGSCVLVQRHSVMLQRIILRHQARFTSK